MNLAKSGLLTSGEHHPNLMGIRGGPEENWRNAGGKTYDSSKEMVEELVNEARQIGLRVIGSEELRINLGLPELPPVSESLKSRALSVNITNREKGMAA